MKRWR